METKPRIRVGRIEMDFSHKGKTLTAVHPFYGPSNSLNLQKQIREAGLREPTAPEVASFVAEYFQGGESQAKEVTKIMKKGSFRGFTGFLYVPEKDGKGLLHVIDHPEFDENSIVSRDNLLQRLNESRTQVPFDVLKKGLVNWQDVENHPYFVAWAGQEGAGKLAELASKHSSKQAYIWVPNVLNLKEPTARVASLNPIGTGTRLDVDAVGHGNNGDSYAFGVKDETCEASSQKI